MSFLSGVLHTVESIARNPVVQTVFPVTAVGSLLGARGIESGLRRLSAFEAGPRSNTTDHALQQYSGPAGYPVNYPYAAGGSTWDYSTQSPGFSTLPVATPVQDYYLQQQVYSPTPATWGWYP